MSSQARLYSADRSWWLAAVLVVVVAAGCNRPDPRPHESLTPDLQALKTQFNQDADRTRVLMIVAPT